MLSRFSTSPISLILCVSTIVFAGREGTATAIAQILYILACRPDVQTRLRTEIRDAKRNHAALSGRLGPLDLKDVELPYDLLMGLPFLDAVIRETLRVHPPTNVLSRTYVFILTHFNSVFITLLPSPRARKATTLPLHYPIRSSSGTMINSIPVPKNTTLIISILAANHNRKVWGEDASVWKPERWLATSGQHVGMKAATTNNTDDIRDSEDALEAQADVKYPGVYGSMCVISALSVQETR